MFERQGGGGGGGGGGGALDQCVFEVCGFMAVVKRGFGERTVSVVYRWGSFVFRIELSTRSESTVAQSMERVGLPYLPLSVPLEIVLPLFSDVLLPN